ncbi:MAG TPA: c-type cytochrome domain-containing protein, partial [Isosphaeraceae bacterium]|nr:c-type cytochrome domain-containing protein [Isosphaeraceae bacterium]
MHTRVWGRGRIGSGFVLIAVAVGLVGIAAADRSEDAVLLAQATKRAKARPKGAVQPKADADAAKNADSAAGAAAGPVFSKEIAPIFVGNCFDCHNPEKRRGKFDLTTFQKLMAGADKEKV